MISIFGFHDFLGYSLLLCLRDLEIGLIDYALSRAHVSCYLRQLLNWYSLDGIEQCVLAVDCIESLEGLGWLGHDSLGVLRNVEEVGHAGGDAFKVRVLVHVLHSLIKCNAS